MKVPWVFPGIWCFGGRGQNTYQAASLSDEPLSPAFGNGIG